MAIDIQWEKKYAVGHHRLDYEHQMLLELIRNLSIAGERGESKEWCVRLLRELRKYLEYHFFSEENTMLKVGYPDYLSHQQHHTEVKTMLDERIDAYQHDRIDIEAMVVYLFDSFAMHSTHCDRKLAKFLTQLPSEEVVTETACAA